MKSVVVVDILGAVERSESWPGGQNALQHAVAASADQQRADADQPGASRSCGSVCPSEWRLVGKLVLLAHRGLRSCVTTCDF